MEGLAPTHQLCIEVRHALENGTSLLTALKDSSNMLEQQIAGEVINILFAFQQQGAVSLRDIKTQRLYRKALYELFAVGLEGEPILSRLKELESEIFLASHEEIERHLAALPLRVMVPLLFLQFPAFLLLMFGPIIREFTKGFL